MMRTLFVLLGGLWLLVGCASDTPASREFEGQELINRAEISATSILREHNLGNSGALLSRAKAVLVVPSHFRAGFLLGAEGGRGVLLARGVDGSWSPPAFFTLAGGSLGLQLGAESAQVMFLLMTDKALEGVLANNFKFGADASVSFGPVGGGRGTALAGGLLPDVYVYSRNMGIYGGGAFNGLVINTKEDWNTAYYGSGATARAIVQERLFDKPSTRPLRDALATQPQ